MKNIKIIMIFHHFSTKNLKNKSSIQLHWVLTSKK